MIGGMRHFIEIISTEPDKDSQGFGMKSDCVIAKVRAYKESRHGNEKWRNRAAFTTANTLFRFRRIPNITVTTAMQIHCDGEKYNIISTEDVHGRKMYVEILCETVNPSAR